MSNFNIFNDDRFPLYTPRGMMHMLAGRRLEYLPFSSREDGKVAFLVEGTNEKVYLSRNAVKRLNR